MSIAQKAARGAAWSVITSIGSRALGLVGTLVLMRWIAPADYGEVSAASVLVLTANQFSTVGVGLYVVANPKAGRETTFHATLIHLALGVAAIALTVALRGSLGPAFEAPSLARYIPGLALSVVLDRLAYIPERVLMRDLRFRSVSLMRTAGEVTYTAVSLSLGDLGWGGMAIVAGSVARSAVKLVITLFSASIRDWAEPHRVRFALVKQLFIYGMTVYVGGLATFAARRWDNLLVSRFHGTSVLGVYNLAYNLADVPAGNIGEQVTDVLMASFAHIEREKRIDALVRTTQLLALVMFPLAIGLGAVAETLTATLLRQTWADVGPMLMLLSVLSIPRPIAGALSAYLQAENRARDVAVLEVLSAGILLSAVATLGQLGPRWVCLAVGVGMVIRMLIAMALVQRLSGARITRFLGQLVMPLVACGPLVLAVLGARALVARGGLGGGVVSLVAEIVAGSVGFIVAALLVAREPLREILRLARRAAKR